MKSYYISVFALITVVQIQLLSAEPGLPPFSWDTVPVYIHFGKTSGPLTDAELRFVAKTSSFVCLEKGHAKEKLGSTEKGIAHDARRLKEINPKIKVLFYWNTFLNYQLYDACAEFSRHPEWVFRDKSGKPIYKTGNLEQYNLLNPEFRAWWATVAGRGVKEYNCDGIFMDAVNQAKRPLFLKQGWGEGKEGELTGAVRDMMSRARQEMGGEALLLYNGLRTNDQTGKTTGEEYLDCATGINVEHFGAFNSKSRESIARDIEAIMRAGRNGKMVVVKGWPDQEFNWMNPEKMKQPAGVLAQEAKEKITFPLACFLVAAQPYSYFCYSWGYREQHGSLVDYPEFHKPLGSPLSDAVRDGWRYSRRFKHAKVEVDLEKRSGRIQFGR